MLRIIQSNDAEVLVAHLLRRAESLAEPGLAAERYVVPSLGFGRWLQNRIAEERGICANLALSYPAQFIWELFSRVLPEIPPRSPFDSEVMNLRLYTLLQALPQDADHAALNAWLAGQDARGRLELATQIARLFQHYLAYRPDWLEAWAQGRTLALTPPASERWQLRLWQQLLQAEPVGGPRHPKDAVFAELARRRAAGAPLHGLLPREIRIVGVPSLPPLYLDIFAQLSDYTEVAIGFLNPCRQYWGDIASEARRARLAAAGAAQLPEVGHPLLASWGRQSRDQFLRFAALAGVEGVEDASGFVEPHGASLLARLQGSILDLAPLPTWTPSSDERSLRIHACHSLLRQCEVLHDELLRRFQHDPELSPAEVLVMAPDIDEAADVIDAVFGVAPPARYLPYAISGRARIEATPLAQALNGVLDLLDSRFELSAVLDLLRLPPIARALTLDEDQFERLGQWLLEAGVRWGRDAEHRAALGLPAVARHSWAEGLQRLLLGYAHPTDGQALSGGLMPYEALEGSDAQTLGQLLQVLGRLARLAEQVARPRSLPAWSELLLRLMDRLLAPGAADHAEDRQLREALADIATDAARAECREAVPLSVARLLLTQRLGTGAPGGVPSGRITFTGVQPLRGLPYRIICLIGLDDGQFPRNPSPLEFDLTVSHPRAGDRLRREEDRGAFLDALVAARDALWLCYTGRSQRDNAPLPPSILVTELLDYLGRSAEGGRPAVDTALLTEHPLQAFSPRYFDGSLPRSYAAEFLGAAHVARLSPLQRGGARALFAAPLPPPSEDWRDVGLPQLIAFLRHPVRYLLRERLGLRIEAGAEIPEDEEPFIIARGADTRLAQRLLDLRLRGMPAPAAQDLLAQAPELPHGEPGRRALEAESRRVETLLERVQAARPAGLLPPRSFELRIEGFRLHGTLDGLTAQGLLRVSVRDFGWSELIELWPRHLALNALAPEDLPARSQLVAGEREQLLQPRTDAREQLAGLLRLYWEGLCAPSGFAPKSAHTYFEKGRKLAAAYSTWRSGFGPGENADVWYRQVYGGHREELPEGFVEAAETAFGVLYPRAAES